MEIFKRYKESRIYAHQAVHLKSMHSMLLNTCMHPLIK